MQLSYRYYSKFLLGKSHYFQPNEQIFCFKVQSLYQTILIDPTMFGNLLTKNDDLTAPDNNLDSHGTLLKPFYVCQLYDYMTYFKY